MPIIIIIKALFQTLVGILGIDYAYWQTDVEVYSNIYIYIHTHKTAFLLHLHPHIYNSNTSPEMSMFFLLPGITTTFFFLPKLKMQKLYDIWDCGSAVRSLGGREGKKKKKTKIATTLGSGMHHCVDDVCGDRWQLKRACSRTVVSHCWLWYSLGLLGLCCCVLFNNPNPLSPPQPTSFLWLFLVFFIMLYCNLIIFRRTIMVHRWRGRAEQGPQTVPPNSFRLQGSLANP